MNNNWFNLFAEQKKIELIEQENNFINELFNLVKIDYSELFKNIKFHIPNNNLDLNIIIPVKGRKENLNLVVSRFLINLKKFNNINITVVENSEISEHHNFCEKNNLNYIWIPLSSSGLFNKSLCMNVGVLLTKSSSFLFHDVDLIFSDNFLEDVLKNYDNKIIQCFSEKSIFNLDENETNQIFYNKINLEDLFSSIKHLKSSYTRLPPGGSILINSELFYEVGGFDDNIFEGWGHEDEIFKMKIESKFNISIPPCKSPNVFVIHLYHPVESENKANLKTLETFNSMEINLKNRIVREQCERFSKLRDYVLNNL